MYHARGGAGGLPRPLRRVPADRRGRGAAAEGVGLRALPAVDGARLRRRRRRRRASSSAVGARRKGRGLRYPVDEVALRHGAGVEEETTDPSEAYARFAEDRADPLSAGVPGWLTQSRCSIMSVAHGRASVQRPCGDALRPAHLLALAERRGLAGDRGEALAVEADDDRVALARVLVDRRVLGEAQLRRRRSPPRARRTRPTTPTTPSPGSGSQPGRGIGRMSTLIAPRARRGSAAARVRRRRRRVAPRARARRPRRPRRSRRAGRPRR